MLLVAGIHRYEKLWGATGAVGDAPLSAGQASKLLATSGLPDSDLRRIWHFCKQGSADNGAISKHEFHVACKLISVRQSGGELTAAALRTVSELPKFGVEAGALVAATTSASAAGSTPAEPGAVATAGAAKPESSEAPAGATSDADTAGNEVRWQTELDPATGTTYFVNLETDQTQWEMPDTGTVLELVENQLPSPFPAEHGESAFSFEG